MCPKLYCIIFICLLNVQWYENLVHSRFCLKDWTYHINTITIVNLIYTYSGTLVRRKPGLSDIFVSGYKPYIYPYIFRGTKHIHNYNQSHYKMVFLNALDNFPAWLRPYFLYRWILGHKGALWYFVCGPKPLEFARTPWCEHWDFDFSSQAVVDVAVWHRVIRQSLLVHKFT